MAIYGNMVVPRRGQVALPTPEGTSQGIYVPGQGIKARISTDGAALMQRAAEIQGNAVKQNGEELVRLGHAINAAAVKGEDAYLSYQNTKARDAYNRYVQEEMQMRPEWDKLQGSNALDEQNGVIALKNQWQQDARQRYMEGLNSDAQQMFRRRADQYDAVVNNWALQKVNREMNAFQDSTDKGTIDIAAQRAMADPSYLPEAMGVIMAANDRMGARKGSSREEIQAKTQNEVSAMFAATIGTMVSSGDLEGAERLYLQSRRFLSADKAALLQDELGSAYVDLVSSLADSGNIEEAQKIFDRVSKGGGSYSSSSQVQGVTGASTEGAGGPTSARNLSMNNFGNVKNKSGKYNAYATKHDGLMGVGERVLRYNNAPERGWHAQTILEMVEIYAPRTDKNNPEEYAKYLGDHIGVDPRAKVNFYDPNILAGLIKYMPKYEHSARVPISDEEAREAANALLSGEKPKIVNAPRSSGQSAGGSGGMIPPDDLIKMKHTLDAAKNKVEHDIGKAYADVPTLLKYGNTARAYELVGVYEKAGLQDKAKALKGDISTVEATQDVRKAAAAMPLSQLQAWVSELGYQARGDTHAMPHEDLTRAEGLLTPGNIDLHKRPQVKLPDGSVATVRSASFEFDGKQVLLPTISEEGKELSPEEAVKLYKTTGKHLGVFDTPEHATAYATSLHENQEAEYVNGRAKDVTEQQRAVSRFKAASDILEDRVKAYKTDPAAAAMKDEGLVLPSNATPEDKARILMDLQAKNGVVYPMPLTKQEVEVLGKQYEESSTPVAFLTSLKQSYGDQTNAVIGQLVKEKKVPRQANLILDMDPNAAGILAVTSRKDWVKNAEKAREMKDYDRISLKGKVLNVMSNELNTIMMQGDMEGVEAVTEAAYGMAIYYMSRGISESDAVSRACQEAFAGRYKVNGSFRVPVQYAATDEEMNRIVQGAAWSLKDITKKPGDFAISVPVQTYMTEEQINKRKGELIRSNAKWVTNRDESGLYLVIGPQAAPLRKKDGSLFEVKFTDLATMGKDRGSTEEEVVTPYGVIYQEKE